MKNPRRLTHLLYMDDLKLYAETQDKLESLINVARMFSDDIGMKFGLDKCGIINIHKGIVQNSNQIVCDIKQIPPEETYRYLGNPRTIDWTIIVSRKNFE